MAGRLRRSSACWVCTEPEWLLFSISAPPIRSLGSMRKPADEAQDNDAPMPKWPCNAEPPIPPERSQRNLRRAGLRHCPTGENRSIPWQALRAMCEVPQIRLGGFRHGELGAFVDRTDRRSNTPLFQRIIVHSKTAIHLLRLAWRAGHLVNDRFATAFARSRIVIDKGCPASRKCPPWMNAEI